jgi:hypothetical protein
MYSPSSLEGYGVTAGSRGAEMLNAAQGIPTVRWFIAIVMPSQDEDFHDLIAERYERASTILPSNLDFRPLPRL